MAVLTDRGLGPALQGLLARAPVPVEITEMPEERLAGPVEAAAYYVVAEAITNVAKYADASLGTGLRGLADRLEALDGRLEVDSPTAHGTRISAEIPTP
jgi:signal transduction histidine kinase